LYLFVRPTDAGRAYIGDVSEAPTYERSKNFFLVEEEIDGTEWLTELSGCTSCIPFGVPAELSLP